MFKDDCLVIYEVRQKCDCDENQFSYWYEVFKRTVKQADMYHNDEFEKYPYDECFGVLAWCCANENCVGKVLYNHFLEHRLTELLSKHQNGTYKVNGIDKPLFKLSKDDLMEGIRVLQNSI